MPQSNNVSRAAIRGFVRGGSPLRGVWGVPKKSFLYQISHRAILEAGRQGRPQGSPLPDCMASGVPRSGCDLIAIFQFWLNAAGMTVSIHLLVH